jgi:hypothetical protein
MINAAITLLDTISKVNRERNKAPFKLLLLDQLSTVQLLARVANESKALPLKSYAEISAIVDSISRQANGWIRSS